MFGWLVVAAAILVLVFETSILVRLVTAAVVLAYLLMRARTRQERGSDLGDDEEG